MGRKKSVDESLNDDSDEYSVQRDNKKKKNTSKKVAPVKKAVKKAADANKENKKNNIKNDKQKKTNNNKKEGKEKEKDNENFIIGQKYQTPPDGDGTRAFYQSLFEQKPDSKMAQKWCLEFGVLSELQANDIYNLTLKNNKKK